MTAITLGTLQLQRPFLLALLLLIPITGFLYLRHQRNRRSRVIKFAAVDLFPTQPRVRTRRHLPFAAALLSSVMLVIAAAGPAVQGAVFSQRKQVVVVLDVSKSMDATDVAPSRLSAAKEGATKFLDSVPDGFEVGLVAFSDVVRVLSTPTLDRELLKGKVSALVPQTGTATGDALVLALSLFGQETEGSTIVILSDGRQTSGLTTVEQAAGALAGAGVSVYAIALGTPTGKVSIFDENRGEQVDVEVPPDPAGLTLLAEITGGKMFEAVTIDELNTIYESVGGAIKPQAGWVSLAWAFALISLVLLALAALLSTRWSRLL
jgi:Ca-activated chloride channel family protein